MANDNEGSLEEASKGGSEAVSRESILREIEDALRGLRFGQVVVVVQDGVAVQIERIERRRLR